MGVNFLDGGDIWTKKCINTKVILNFVGITKKFLEEGEPPQATTLPLATGLW